MPDDEPSNEVKAIRAELDSKLLELNTAKEVVRTIKEDVDAIKVRLRAARAADPSDTK